MAGYVIPEVICLYLPYILGKIRPWTQYQEDQTGMKASFFKVPNILISVLCKSFLVKKKPQYQDQSGMFKSGEQSNTLHT
jgi:hypothetical protein